MAMGVLLVAGAKLRYIGALSAASPSATVCAAFVGRLVNDYQLDRVRVLFDENNPDLRDASYQVTLAMQALGTGGLFGKGWLQGPLTNNADIPVLWADFPFAAVGEQFGLVGCAVLLGLFGVALLRIWRIAHLSRDMFGTYVCGGVFTMLVWQVVQNIGMTMKHAAGHRSAAAVHLLRRLRPDRRGSRCSASSRASTCAGCAERRVTARRRGPACSSLLGAGRLVRS